MFGLKFTLSDITSFLPDNLSELLKKIIFRRVNIPERNYCLLLFTLCVAVRSQWRKMLAQKSRTCLCKLCTFIFNSSEITSQLNTDVLKGGKVLKFKNVKFTLRLIFSICECSLRYQRSTSLGS